MAWAPTKVTAGAGLWNQDATWNPAAVPLDTDYVEINHVVSMTSDGVCAGLYSNGGELNLSAGKTLTVSDVAGTHSNGAHVLIGIAAGSGWDSGGSMASPVVVKSASTTPTYPLKFAIEHMTTTDSRTLDFSYCEIRNCASFIGNSNYWLWFNTGDVTNDGILNPPIPLRRDLKIDELYCEGRDYGRVYPEGGHAGVLELSGLVPWAGWGWAGFSALRDLRYRVSYVGQFCTLSKAYVESIRFGLRDGPYIPFTLTLVEAD